MNNIAKSMGFCISKSKVAEGVEIARNTEKKAQIKPLYFPCSDLRPVPIQTSRALFTVRETNQVLEDTIKSPVI